MLGPFASRYGYCGRCSRTKCGASVRPELLADSVNEELHAAAARTHVDVEVLAVFEQLSQVAEHAPLRALVEFLAALVFQRRVAARTRYRVFGHGPRLSMK